METNGNMSLKREKGCFLSSVCIFILIMAFLIMVIATGLLVYFFANKPHWKFREELMLEQRNIAGMKTKHTMPARVMDVRLPRSIKPLHYHVKLIPFITGNFSIHGYCAMTFVVLEATNNVTMHINGIITKNETAELELADNNNGSKINIRKHIYDRNRQFYIALLDEDLQEGMNYVIKMDYIGYLNDNMNGFYRSSYIDEEGNTVWLAATQFQSTDARKAFPCLDEPALKANFTIEIAREKTMTSIANMPLQESVPMKGNPDWWWDKFETSVPMSTYLVAFVVSDFANMKSSDDIAYDFQVWTRKSVIHQAEYALSIGPQVSKFFEDYFQVPFPLPKQDMIALPDFSAGAMENWGLITYREIAMLYDSKTSRSKDKFRVGQVIVHELAHQWFGNLVTPSWWTDLWLNEGFASYMEYVGLSVVEPSYKVKELFVIAHLYEAFELDCLDSSHQISMEVQNPIEISEIFDKISYSKGAALIRMMNHILGENTFRKGLSKYLRGLAYSSAEQDDLWQYLTDQAFTDGTLDVSVKTIMDTWTLQMGLPVITVTKIDNETTLLTQERFLLLKSENSTDSHDYKWWVPITFATQNSPDFTATKPKEWMKPSESTKIIKGVPSTEWVIFNVQQTGYYRVNYDEENWEAIIEQLQSDHTVIDTVNRAQIIDDSLALAKAGLLPYGIAMKVFSYLRSEDEFVPWKSTLSGLEFIEVMFAQSGGYASLKEFLLSLTIPMYEKLGFEERTDSYLEQRKRALILNKVCSLGYQPCVDVASTLLRAWMRTPENYTIIPPNLKPAVYCTALKNGGYKEWKFIWSRYQKADVPSEKRTILQALGCTKETWIQGGYLDRALAEDGIRRQDIQYVFYSVLRTEQGKMLAWDYFRDRYTDLFKLFGKSSFLLGNIVRAVTNSLNTRNHLHELEVFKERYEGRLGTAEQVVTQSLEKVKHNLHWMDSHYITVLGWLNDNGYNDSSI